MTMPEARDTPCLHMPAPQFRPGQGRHAKPQTTPAFKRYWLAHHHPAVSYCLAWQRHYYRGISLRLAVTAPPHSLPKHRGLHIGDAITLYLQRQGETS